MPAGTEPPAAPVEGTKTMTPGYGVPVAMPAESVGVMRPVEVKSAVPTVDVIVGRLAPDAPPAVGGTKTMTPLNGEPVGRPESSVGVMMPVEVKAALPTVVIVGRPTPAPVDGTRTMTPLYGVPVGLPAALVGVIRPVLVTGETRLPATEVIVGRPPGLEAAEAVGGSKTTTPLNGVPVGGVIRPVLVNGETTLPTIEVIVGRPAPLETAAAVDGSKTRTPLNGAPDGGVIRPVDVIGPDSDGANEVIVGRAGPVERAAAVDAAGSMTMTPLNGVPFGRVITPVYVKGTGRPGTNEVSVGRPAPLEMAPRTGGTKTTAALYGVPVAIPAELVGLTKLVLVNGGPLNGAPERLAMVEVIVGSPGADAPGAPVGGTNTMTPLNGVPRLPSELVGVMRPVEVKGEAILATMEVIVGRPSADPALGTRPPVGGTNTMMPLNGAPALPAELVGVMRPVDVKGEAILAAIEVIVGRPNADAPLESRPPVGGTNTMTPLNGAPALPIELVGVMSPVEVNGEATLAAIEVIVGRPDAEAPPRPVAAVGGTKTMTPANGDPVTLPAESVGVIRPVDVKGEATLATIEVIVGRPNADPPLGTMAPVGGTNTITPLNGVPSALPAELVGVIRPVDVKGEATLATTEVTVGRPDGDRPPGTRAETPLGTRPPVGGTKTITPPNAVPSALPAELVGVIRPVDVNGEAMLAAIEVIVGRPDAADAPPSGTKTMSPLYGVPTALPAASVGVMRPADVKGEVMLPTVEVTSGKLAPGAPLGRPVGGTKTMTPLNGAPVGGVMMPVEVNGETALLAIEVIVGKPPETRAVGTPLGMRPEGPPGVCGSKTIIPLNGVPVGGVMMPVEVKGETTLAAIDVIVGRLGADAPLPVAVDGTKTITPLNGDPLAGVITPVDVDGAVKSPKMDVVGGKPGPPACVDGAKTITPLNGAPVLGVNAPVVV